MKSKKIIKAIKCKSKLISRRSSWGHLVGWYNFKCKACRLTFTYPRGDIPPDEMKDLFCPFCNREVDVKFCGFIDFSLTVGSRVDRRLAGCIDMVVEVVLESDDLGGMH